MKTNKITVCNSDFHFQFKKNFIDIHNNIVSCKIEILLPNERKSGKRTWTSTGMFLSCMKYEQSDLRKKTFVLADNVYILKFDS